MQYFGFDRPSFGIKTYGFGDNFDPLTLFAGDKQGVWFDPSDLSTLYQDVAGTVPVTKDGDPVALMKDKSGNGNHATQSVSASRPIYKTDGILHWLEFDGVDDHLLSSFTATTTTTLVASAMVGSKAKGYLLDYRPVIGEKMHYHSHYTIGAMVAGVDPMTTRDMPQAYVIDYNFLPNGEYFIGLNYHFEHYPGEALQGQIYQFIKAETAVISGSDKPFNYVANKAGVAL